MTNRNLTPEEAKRRRRRKAKIIALTSIGLAAALTVFILIKFYFVFGEGVKAGELNYVVYKGYIFKTYEGRVIQAGYNSKNTSATIQSNEFRFSVDNKRVADSLMRCAGRQVELHYKEYLGALPWRGKSQFVVDSIISAKQMPEFPSFPLN